MVARRALAAAGCSHCRSTLLGLFLTPSTPLIRARSIQAWPSPLMLRTGRNFSSSPILHKTSELDELRGDSLEQNIQKSAAEDDEGSIELAATSSESEAPWYLQVEPPRHAGFAESPPLPDIPADSPAIIGALLEYAAEEMGLDDISILDLRPLETPAALGPNLFMLFGTARSERHLNVSAGRLVRWLRGKHHVFADADGLLGPNERKTKLRRRAKRAKLLGTMGTDDADDGMSTGWICVNLGTISRNNEEATVLSEDGRVSGFSVAHEGFTIVFQVMTEARRAEMGLEVLWQRFLERQTKKLEQQEADSLEGATLEHTDSPTLPSDPVERAILSKSQSQPKPRWSKTFGTKSTPGRSQASFFSTCSRSRSPSAPLGRVPETTSPLLSDAQTVSQTLLTDGKEKLLLLDFLRIHLEKLSPAEVETTMRSQVFSNLFYQALQNLPADQTWPYRLAIIARAVEVRPVNDVQSWYTAESVSRLVKELRLFGISASRHEYAQLVTCIYTVPGFQWHERTALGLELLECLQLRGDSIMCSDILVPFIEGASASHNSGGKALQERLEDLLVQTKQTYMGEALLMRLATVYARQLEWKKFWNVWRTPPRFSRPRSHLFYTHFLSLVAATESRPLCIHALRQCVSEMSIESPRVLPIREVRDAMLACVRIADPKAEELAGDGSKELPKEISSREFVALVRMTQQLVR